MASRVGHKSARKILAESGDPEDKAAAEAVSLDKRMAAMEKLMKQYSNRFQKVAGSSGVGATPKGKGRGCARPGSKKSGRGKCDGSTDGENSSGDTSESSDCHRKPDPKLPGELAPWEIYEGSECESLADDSSSGPPTPISSPVSSRPLAPISSPAPSGPPTPIASSPLQHQHRHQRQQQHQHQHRRHQLQLQHLHDSAPASSIPPVHDTGLAPL